MQRARKIVKILHTVAAGGLIGGLATYMVLLVVATPTDPAAYAGLRGSLEVVSGYILVPSLAIGLLSGLVSMLVHTPFLDKGWVWFKALLGILMFKGVLTIDSAKADYAADLSQKIADGTASEDALQSLLGLEWWTCVGVMAVAVANVVLGVWRPNRFVPRTQPAQMKSAPAK
ncbi:MAG: DUF2269 family protein [Pseudomonadota bacterium]